MFISPFPNLHAFYLSFLHVIHWNHAVYFHLQKFCFTEQTSEHSFTAQSYSGPRGYKTFSSLALLRLKLILLINVKIPTIVGILTFMSRINYRL